MTETKQTSEPSAVAPLLFGSNTSLRRIVLASGSPRRRELMEMLGVPFTVSVKPGVGEAYPDGMPPESIPEYIAREKADAYIDDLASGDLLLTADTVVILDGRILGKPKSDADARRMLADLSAHVHQVTTGCCLAWLHRGQLREHSFHVTTDVAFRALSPEEIAYYVNTYHPLDKAGAYGIQEWIGCIGVRAINGSFYNVMGLPVQRIWQEIKAIARE